MPLVALVALRGTRTASHGALTLLVTSVTSFALLVLGSALWLTATGDAAFAADSVATAWADPQRRAVLVLGRHGAARRLGFKLSLVPFHAWTPQAYSTADLGTAARAAAASKLSAAGGAARGRAGVVGAAVDAGARGRRPRSARGGVHAARQRHGAAPGRRDPPARVVDRGPGGLGRAARRRHERGGSPGGSAAYVVVYAVATIVAFAAVAVVGAGPLSGFRGLLRRDSLTGGALALALLVLAGLPPGIIGLVAKVVALGPAVDAGLWPLVLVAVVAVVLGIAVYLRWFALLLAEPEGPRTTGTGPMP